MTSMTQGLADTGMIPPVNASQLGPGAPTDTTKPKAPPPSAMAAYEENAKEIQPLEDKLKSDEKKVPVLPTVENGMLKEPPKNDSESDPMRGYVSTIGVLGAVASMFSRVPLTHAMNAAAGVLNGMNKASAEEFKQKYETWKAQNDNALAYVDYEQKVYENILKNDRLSIEDKQSQLTGWVAAFKDDQMAEHMKNQDMDAAERLSMDRGKVASEAAKNSAEVAKLGEQKTAYDAAKTGLDADLNAGKITQQQYAKRLQEAANPTLAAANARAQKITAADKKRAEDVQEITDVRADVAELREKIRDDPTAIGTKGILRRGFQSIVGQTAEEKAQDTESELVKQQLLGVRARIGKIILNTRYFSGPAQKQAEALLPGLEAVDDPGKVSAALENIDRMLAEKAREKGGAKDQEDNPNRELTPEELEEYNQLKGQ